MFEDILILQKFYQSKKGLRLQQTIQTALKDFTPPYQHDLIVGLGYATPWLEQYQNLSEDILAFMPAGQGATPWPSAENNKTALVNETSIPLADNTVDFLLMSHYLEYSRDLQSCLNEAWRILSPEGRLTIVVPYHLNSWSRVKNIPFNNGQPYNLSQLINSLRDSNFSTATLQSSIYRFPDHATKATAWLDKIKKILPIFSGILILQAQKRVVTPLTGRPSTSGTPFSRKLALARIYSKKQCPPPGRL